MGEVGVGASPAEDTATSEDGKQEEVEVMYTPKMVSDDDDTDERRVELQITKAAKVHSDADSGASEGNGKCEPSIDGRRFEEVEEVHTGSSLYGDFGFRLDRKTYWMRNEGRY